MFSCLAVILGVCPVFLLLLHLSPTRLWRRRSLKRRELREQRQMAANAALSSLSLGPPIRQARDVSFSFHIFHFYTPLPFYASQIEFLDGDLFNNIVRRLYLYYPVQWFVLPASRSLLGDFYFFDSPFLPI